MKSFILATVVVAQFCFTAVTFAGGNMGGAFLDPAYKNLKHPLVNDKVNSLSRFFDLDINNPNNPPAKVDTSRSDILDMLAKMTPVRNQLARGTCSIFSSTAMFESMLVIKGEATTAIDLSEEWLEYLVTRATGTEGSTSSANFDAILDNGDVTETALPYIGETWSDVTDSTLAQQRCGTLSDDDLAKCLLGHRDPNLFDAPLTELAISTDHLYDPDFLAARNAATSFQKTLQVSDRDYTVDNTADIKALLRQGIPVSVEVSFYYGAWNHGGGDALGMTRNMDDWAKGIVFYPEVGSIDRDRSPEQPDGHSVLIIGYDDNVVLTKAVQMTDGTTQTFTRTGVYYFKNSWGTDNFGPLAMIDGKSFPGYGTMSQDYANEFGQFYQLPLQ
jgi:hypothetical protein